LSEQYFSAVQKFVVFDLGLTLLPVSGQTEASQLITQIVSSEKQEKSNTDLWGKPETSSQLLDPLILALVQQVPGGRQGQSSGPAAALLQHPEALQRRPAQLEPIVGHAAAQQIHNFFHKPRW
uniref:Fanconi anemia core complex-associated protein 24 pseudonuclease domain-containing protein n=1 Tax=Dicentrarchus labrax TaxID=13489 RepID=A0A8P4JVM5_DICLA